MRRRSGEDLFKTSTMTFGQHLEELRVCLFRAILGLVIGCGVGLLVGAWVVDFIQSPLQKALSRYLKSQSIKNLEKLKGPLADAGHSEQQVSQIIDSVKDRVADRRLTVELVYVDRKNLLAELQNPPGQAPVAPLAAEQVGADNNELILMPIFRPAADDPRARMRSFNAQEPFMIYLKASMLVGVILASPWVFFQIWSFVAAGLYPHEKRYVHVFLPVSLGLFLLGASMAFFLVFEPVLNFLFSFNSMLGIDPDPRISEWMGFVLMLPLGFGVSFQLPLVMLFLERIGVFTVSGYLKSWRIAILAIFVLAMILTPSGDPYSMMLMALPLCVLYFGGVLLCRYLPRRKSAFEP
jgi:sec-independent protein translocase protein TatC